MKLKLLAILALVLPCFAQASDWSLGVYYSLTRNEAAMVAANKLTTVQDLFNIKGFSVDVNAFAGATQGGATIAGFSATISRTAGKNLKVFIGPAIEGDLNRFNTLRPGLHFGASYKF